MEDYFNLWLVNNKNHTPNKPYALSNQEHVYGMSIKAHQNN